MAGRSKSTTKAADIKTEEVKTAPVETAAKAEETKKTTRKTTARKTTAKKAEAEMVPAEKKTRTRKTAVEEAVPVQEAEVKASVQLQFAGRQISTEELVQNAKNVWEFDLNRKPEDFKTVELYVKPEESIVYYVINGDVNGNFGL